MPKLVLVRDPRFQDHLTPELHPESPQRLAAIDKALYKSHLIDKLRQVQPRSATEDDLVSVHKLDYIEHLHDDAEKARKKQTLLQLDEDTWMSADTFETAKLAAGAGLVAVDSLKGHEVTSSFVAVRPPGHHALADRPMGFCLFNNIALAARYAQKKLGFKRIFIIDWDVHHGNGTQDMFFADPSVFFVSFHQYPFWPPNSGWYSEDGVGDGKGYNMNIPLPAGTGDRGYLAAWDRLVKPVCQEYKPDLIMLSAGYDAHQFDPLGQQLISTSGYALLSQKLLELAGATNTKVVGFLEGGYNTKSLSEAVIATMEVLNSGQTADMSSLSTLAGKQSSLPVELLKPVTGDRSPHLVDDRIHEVRRYFASYWKSLR